MPRLGLADGPFAAAPRDRRALRVRLFDPAEGRRRLARRAIGRVGGHRRPARVVRGLPAGRRLDRLRPDQRPPDRRRLHPARGHGRPVQRRADLRRAARHREGRVPPHDEGHADVRVAARDVAVHAVAMERDRRARRGRRCASRSDGRAPHAGWRADLRRDREPRGRRVEHRSPRAHQARLRDAAAAEADRPLRRERLHALRAGQVVPRRAVAALGVVGAVARRRRGVRVGSRAVRRRSRRCRRQGPAEGRGEAGHGRRCGAPDRGHRAVVRAAGRLRDAGLRGRLPGHVAQRSTADQHGGRRGRTEEAGAGAERSREGAGRLRAAAGAGRGPDASGRRQGRGLGLESLADAQQPAVAVAGRIGDGLSPAARRAAVGRPEGLPVPGPARPVRVARSAAVADRAEGAPDPGAVADHRRGRTAAAEGADRPEARRGRQVGVVGRAHRALRRAARRAPARVHAAGRRRRALSRAAGRHRDQRRRARRRDRARGLPAAARSAGQAAAGHARPGRDRGQHPSGVELEGTRRPHRVPLPHRARDAPRDREVHGRRQAHGHRRRQPLRARRRDAGRQPVPAQSAAADEPGRLLAEPSVAVVPVLRRLHRADEPGAARRRGARRPALRTRDRVRRSAATGRGAEASRRHRRSCRGHRAGRSRTVRDAVDGRPGAPQHPRRRHRQHAPVRILHRQAVFAGRPDRPPRAARAAGVRNAARTRR